MGDEKRHLGRRLRVARGVPSVFHHPSRAAVLSVCAVILTGCVTAWVTQGDPTRRIASHLLVYGLAFVAYLVALAAAGGLSPRGLGATLALAVGWRLALALAPPLLSNDVNRYVWEGRVQVHGGNPYAWSDRPDAPWWAALRDGVWRGLNHPDYTAVYPPLWQVASWAVVAVHDGITAMKLFLTACELLVLWPLAVLLERRRLPRERLLILAWSPLALVEIAGSGHNEAFGLLLLVLSLAALETARPLLSALLAALGFLAKFLPGLVAVAWARRYRPPHVLAAALATFAFVYPYWRGAEKTFFLSLSKYSEFWRFNETLFALLAVVTGSHRAAVRAGAVLVVLLAVVLAWRRAEPVAAATAVVAASLLLGPNVLPWYALWLVPLLVLRDEPGGLLFTGTVGLAYLVYPAWQSGERWQIGWGIRALEYGPCLAVAILALRRRKPLTRPAAWS
jgi:alpha-1,6-mannosyltransferase